MILLVFQRMDGRDGESKGRKINVPATEIVEARNKCPTKAVLVGMERMLRAHAQSPIKRAATDVV